MSQIGTGHWLVLVLLVAVVASLALLLGRDDALPDRDPTTDAADLSGAAPADRTEPNLVGAGGGGRADAAAVPVESTRTLRGRPDPRWAAWFEAFVANPDKQPRPAGYRGTSLMWRMTPPNTVSEVDQRKLISGIEHLASRDQVTVLGHVGWRGTMQDATLLADKSDELAHSTMISHLTYAESMLRILDRTREARSTRAAKNRAAVQARLDDGVEPLLAAIRSTTNFVRERGSFADDGAWRSIKRTVSKLSVYQPSLHRDLQGDWSLLAEGLLAPLVQNDDSTRRAPHLPLRLEIVVVMAMLPGGGRELTRVLEEWHLARNWLDKTLHVAPAARDKVLGIIVRLIWRHGHERARRDLVEWLEAQRGRPTLTESEHRIVRSEVRDFASPANPAPEFARSMIASWEAHR